MSFFDALTLIQSIIQAIKDPDYWVLFPLTFLIYRHHDQLQEMARTISFPRTRSFVYHFSVFIFTVLAGASTFTTPFFRVTQHFIVTEFKQELQKIGKVMDFYIRYVQGYFLTTICPLLSLYLAWFHFFKLDNVLFSATYVLFAAIFCATGWYIELMFRKEEA